MDQLKEAILRTIRYGKSFKAEYGGKEIKERLISEKSYPDGEIESKIQEMKLPKVKKTKRGILANKIGKVKKLGELLAERFENILMVGITGSVAAGCPKENEDIDLMIITKEDNLWSIRFLIKIWTWFNKIPQRKYRVKQKKDDFCFNLWLEEGSLKLPDNRQGLKNAMDLILMKPIINKNKIYERFIRENDWVKKYVAKGYTKIISNFKFLPKGISQSSKISNEKQKTNIMGKIINRAAFAFQYGYMKRKIKRETVDLKRAFFHPKTERDRILG